MLLDGATQAIHYCEGGGDCNILEAELFKDGQHG